MIVSGGSLRDDEMVGPPHTFLVSTTAIPLDRDEVQACNGDLCGPLILQNSFHCRMLSLIKLIRWRCCAGSAMLAQPRSATTIVPSYHHLLALYDWRGWLWLRKHGVANTGTPPGYLDEANKEAVKAVM